jgi:magnesium chelatase subunit I
MEPEFHYPFSAIVGQDEMCLALLLAAIDPGIGGVLIQGPRGTAKSTSARALTDLLDGGRLVTLPLGTTEERLIGSLDLDRALGEGRVGFQPGLLQAAHGGVLYVDEVNLLPDHLVDVLLDVAASGINRVERDGLSHSHPARFVLIGTMNPEEGDLRPQLLDRFGMCVQLGGDLDPQTRIRIVRQRLAFDTDPAAFLAQWADQQTATRQRCSRARARLWDLSLDTEIHELVAQRCHQARVEGVRADLVMLRGARAHAAWQERDRVVAEDVDTIAELALRHRRAGEPDPPVVNTRRPAESRTGAMSGGGDRGDQSARTVATGEARAVAGVLGKN